MRAMKITLLLLLLPAFAFAQESPCTNDMNIQQCTDAIVGSTLDVAVAAEKSDVAKEATGVPAVNADAGNSLRDFLSFFAAAVETATLSEKDDALTLDWNLRINELGEDPVKLQAVFRKPALWKPFADKITNAADRDKLIEGLDDLDDVTVSATYAPESIERGRNLEPHRPLFRRLVNGSGVGSRQPTIERLQLGLLLQDVELTDEGEDVEDFEDIKFEHIKKEADRAKVKDAVIAAANALKKNRAAYDALFAGAGLDRFSDLLSNQPQIYFSVGRRERDSLSGPRETNLKVTYEKGFVNLNTFRSAKAESCAKSDEDCAVAFKAYVRQPDVIQGLEAANRVSLSIEYADVGEVDITTTLLPEAFHAEGSRKTNGSFTYGRVLRRGEQNRDGRVDVSLTYEDVKGDPNLDNRWIGSAIYTQKLSDTVSIPIGFVWANHEMDVPASDERLSAHVGLIFKLPKLRP